VYVGLCKDRPDDTHNAFPMAPSKLQSSQSHIHRTFLMSAFLAKHT